MLFIFSKIFGFLAAPSNLIILIGVAGIALLPTRYFVVGRRLIIASLLLIVVIGILPIGVVLTVPLEARFPRWDPARGAPTGIVVLGGAVSPILSAVHRQVALNDSAERITAAVELARKYPNARIVFSGGNASLFPGRLREATFAARQFEDLGLPPGRVELEPESRNTEENAVFTKRIVEPKPEERWLLVTSAMHMPRAVGVFRQAGFPVEAYPVDYRSAGWRDLRLIPTSFVGGLNRTDRAAHEWVGLLAYWIAGRIAVSFPGP